ncbi:hypothetical protein OEZ71_12520 [Defluviimonas sp. WL0050]|uniref:RNase NYN domain-containing protein n=2 Tax=Albidovulum litorale TaxID=2984134 RepID=A0ABT2ZPP2_9RHOB|nr:hypothetical protein [Defluviimonas sp. WL0050]
MIAPLLLLLLSLAGIIAAYALPGMTDLVIVAGPSLAASLYLLVRARTREKTPNVKPDPAPSGRAYNRRIVVDASDVMSWKDGKPQLETLREVVRHVMALGYTPGVVFDTDAGQVLTGAPQDNAALGRLLGLPMDNVLVIDEDETAETTVLAAARHLGARVVTNGRFRGAEKTHPELHQPGYLIRGGYKSGELWLKLDRVDA